MWTHKANKNETEDSYMLNELGVKRFPWSNISKRTSQREW